MKTLLITRHGKAEKGSYNSDILRELEPRGLKDIKTIASYLKKYNIIPELIITSPAVRTKETANLISEYFNNIPILILNSLYLCSSNEQLDFINSISSDDNTVMLVGHNPSLEILIKKLSGSMLMLPTSGTVVIDFDVENWYEMTTTKGRVRKFFTP